jgi:hypothetical protein
MSELVYPETLSTPVGPGRFATAATTETLPVDWFHPVDWSDRPEVLSAWLAWNGGSA